MTKSVTKIHLAGFRGSTSTFELDFDPRKSLTMLFGENGSGKSTILDAIDVVCNGTIGCLEKVSLGRRPGQYLCSLGSDPTDVQLAIYSNTDCWIGTMRRDAIVVTGPASKPLVRILRRDRILDLVFAEPGERYAALRRFIEIDIVERSEESLRQKWATTSQAIVRVATDQERMVGQLNALWEGEGRPGSGTSAMEWARHRVDAGKEQLTATLEHLTAVVSAIATAVSARDNYRARLEKCNTLNEKLAEVNKDIADQPGISAITAVALLESLEKAKRYIETDGQLDRCPTCQRPIEQAELLEIVNRELDEIAGLQKLAVEQRRIIDSVNIAKTNMEEAVELIGKAISSVKLTVAGTELFQGPDYEIASPSKGQDSVDTEVFLTMCDSFESALETLAKQRDDAQRDVNQFNVIRGYVQGIDEAAESTKLLNRIGDGLKRSHDIMRETRIQFTQAILDDISQEANRLYKIIHPGENIGIDKLVMDEERRASVSQTATFNGHAGVPPQAVFSESHLDTLGFCVWLALVKREAPGATVLLIDDIFSSVDASHLSRIIDLLTAEAPRFLQVIVATHFRLWWERCQSASDIQRIHLGRWSLASGIAAQNMPLVTQQLRELIAEPVLNRQAVSSKAGILLESILDDLAVHYGCTLPRNRQNEYTLGALMNGCANLFRRQDFAVQINCNWDVSGQPENWQPVELRSSYERVGRLQFIRNQVGCHFNLSGMDIPDNDVREFGQATVALFAALTCPGCGMVPSKATSDGMFLRCSCPKRAVRLTPVSLR